MRSISAFSPVVVSFNLPTLLLLSTVQVEAGHLEMEDLIILLQIHTMTVVAKPMTMTMITAVHLSQEIFPMNIRHYENTMYQDMIVNKMGRRYM